MIRRRRKWQVHNASWSATVECKLSVRRRAGDVLLRFVMIIRWRNMTVIGRRQTSTAGASPSPDRSTTTRSVTVVADRRRLWEKIRRRTVDGLSMTTTIIDDRSLIVDDRRWPRKTYFPQLPNILSQVLHHFKFYFCLSLTGFSSIISYCIVYITAMFGNYTITYDDK